MVEKKNLGDLVLVENDLGMVNKTLMKNMPPPPPPPPPPDNRNQPTKG